MEKNKNNIVVLAHNAKKDRLSEFLKDKEQWLTGRTIVATGRTAEHLEKTTFSLPIRHMSPGRSGGYNQITEMILAGEVKMVFFFQDPEVDYAYHEDIKNLLDACINTDTPLAVNESSAKLLTVGLIKMELAGKI
jgi:methylglyoxal synthase